MPTTTHQILILTLANIILVAFEGNGRCLPAGHKIRIPTGQFRFPDVIYLTPERDAAAGVPEYWIVDPATRHVVLLVLKAGVYQEVGIYPDGDTLASSLDARLVLKVTRLFDDATL